MINKNDILIKLNNIINKINSNSYILTFRVYYEYSCYDEYSLIKFDFITPSNISKENIYNAIYILEEMLSNKYEKYEIDKIEVWIEDIVYVYSISPMKIYDEINKNKNNKNELVRDAYKFLDKIRREKKGFLFYENNLVTIKSVTEVSEYLKNKYGIIKLREVVL